MRNLIYQKYLETLIIIFVLTATAWGEEQNIKTGGSEISLYDQIIISSGEKSYDQLVHPLEIYKSEELNGKIQFIIYNDKIMDKRSGEQKNPPLDFINYNTSGKNFILKVASYKNGIAGVLDKNAKYFFKISAESFLNKKIPAVAWKIVKKEEALKLFEKLVGEDSELKILLQSANKCIKEKNRECFSKLLSDKGNKMLSIGAATLWKYDHYECDHGFERIRNDGEIDYGKLLIPWESFSRIFSINLRENEISIGTKDFGKIASIIIETKEQSYCHGKAQRSIHLTLSVIEKEKNERKWKLEVKNDFVTVFDYKPTHHDRW